VPVDVVRAAVVDELAAFDAAFSQWRTDSEIARVNAHASTEPLPVSERFAAVLALALRLAAATDGAFDPTVKPLRDLYRAARSDPRVPFDGAAIAAAVGRIGHDRIAVRNGCIVKARADVQVDLDGIVAGAACDAIAARLAVLGVTAFRLQITGEVLCRGRKPDGEPWRIGVAEPESDVAGGDGVVAVAALRDAALCTSAGYRDFLRRDGVVVHHVFDPRTGHNPSFDLVSASAIATSAAVADAFGKAFLVLGEAATVQAFPRWREFGLESALLVAPADQPGERWRRVEIAWPVD
jgi:thiamine biosynthesis lipoprotein